MYTKSKPLSYTGESNLIIKELDIVAGSGPAIELYNCNNIHITLCRFTNGKTVKSIGVYLYKCVNVVIDYCYMNNLAAGVIASTSTQVLVSDNQMLNMVGPKPRGQFVQLINCYGTGNKIMHNRLENIMGKSNPEDAINIFQSNGTSESPIAVAYNRIRGGGPSTTGGGIALGDGGGSYQAAYENILVNPGQYGMGIAGGSYMSILNNKIYGKLQPFTNVGLVAWDQYNSNSSNITIRGNRINFMSAKGYQNAAWNGGNVGDIKGWDDNSFGDTTITENILPSKLI